MPSSQWNRVEVEHMQCGEKRQTPGSVAVVRLSAIGDTLIAIRSIALLVAEGFDPVFFTQAASLDVARLVPGLRWAGVVEKDGSYRVVSLETGEEVEGFVPQDIIDLQCTARSRRVVKKLRARGSQAQVWRAGKYTFRRLYLLFCARFSFVQSIFRKELNTAETRWSIPNDRLRVVFAQRQAIARFLVSVAHHPASQPQKESFHIPLLPSDLGLNSGGYVVLFPGASLPLKAWGFQKFESLVVFLMEQTDLKIAIVGGFEEAAVAEALVRGRSERVVNLAGTLRLQESLGVLGHAVHVVTGDSFPAHACDVFEVPATVIFGATSPEFGFVPESPRITVRYARLRCSPCTRHGRGRCRFGNMACMERVAVGDVLGDVLASLALRGDNIKSGNK